MLREQQVNEELLQSINEGLVNDDVKYGTTVLTQKPRMSYSTLRSKNNKHRVIFPVAKYKP